MADSTISALGDISAVGTGTKFLAEDSGVPYGISGTKLLAFTGQMPAGSASAGSWPTLASGTLLSAAVAGTIERDANCFYLTTDSGNRGVVPVVNFIRQHADRAAFTSNTSQQAIFDSVAGGALTLSTGTYIFESVVQIKSTSATSGNLKFSLIGGGGATLANVLYHLFAQDAAVNTMTAWSGVSEIVATQTATNMATASTATVTSFMVKGSFECTGSGSIIPSVAQTTAATCVTVAGSYFHVMRVGDTTTVRAGNWA